MLLLQKLAGIDLLRDFFDEIDEDVEDTGPREWFCGLHRYDTKKSIVNIFVNGGAISCFRSKTCQHTFHMAFYAGDCGLIKLLTVKSKPACLPAHECGLHFCKFILEKELGSDNIAVTTIAKEELCGLAGDYTILLPYCKDGHDFLQQYTVVHCDWHVLRCNSSAQPKGFPAPDKNVFHTELIESLTNMVS